MIQQEQHTSARLVVVDPDLNAQCDHVEHHLLLPLVRYACAEGDHALLSAGHEAFRNIRNTLTEAVARGPRVWSPNGRWEHEGIRIVDVTAAETDVLYALLRELSAALVAQPDCLESSCVARALSHIAPSEETAVGLVGALARVLSMVDLVPDADTSSLFAALEAAEGEDVRLTYTQEDAWQRLAHRVTMVLTESAPLHRFLY